MRRARTRARAERVAVGVTCDGASFVYVKPRAGADGDDAAAAAVAVVFARAEYAGEPFSDTNIGGFRAHTQSTGTFDTAGAQHAVALPGGVDATRASAMGNYTELGAQFSGWRPAPHVVVTLVLAGLGTPAGGGCAALDARARDVVRAGAAAALAAADDDAGVSARESQYNVADHVLGAQAASLWEHAAFGSVTACDDCAAARARGVAAVVWLPLAQPHTRRGLRRRAPGGSRRARARPPRRGSACGRIPARAIARAALDTADGTPAEYASPLLVSGVAVDGVASLGAGARIFEYHAQMHVSRVTPASGGVRGGACVTVRGGGFVASARLVCFFGDADAPPLADAHLVNAAGFEAAEGDARNGPHLVDALGPYTRYDALAAVPRASRAEFVDEMTVECVAPPARDALHGGAAAQWDFAARVWGRRKRESAAHPTYAPRLRGKRLPASARLLLDRNITGARPPRKSTGKQK